MVTPEIRQQIHQLIDEANDNQLEIILDVLSPGSKRYSQEDLDNFNERARLFEEGGSKGYSVEESRALIRNKYKQHGV
ncbi:MAG: hypothetical protein V4722_14330 [Bacteroidota bacterium]